MAQGPANMCSGDVKYQAVIPALIAKGCHAEFQRPDQLVVCLNGPVLTGRIWITWREHWFISTWVPTIYAVPDNADVVGLCVACVTHAPDRFYQIPDSIVQQFQLRLLDETARDELLATFNSGEEEEDEEE